MAKLTSDERLDFYRGLDALLRDPTPDGVTRVELAFPYQPGTFGFAFRGLFLTYTFLNPATISVAWTSRIVNPTS